ncbi:uncharacterized protein ASCRUDRAFT_138736 [Ascoidea rubescens DSM 1968]|uniref:mRNA stability protein n=1 Tax=Ascoidea rubescens DSM 1968 TaxID=1344418 RepID=A0A1D2VJU8_9ASCO|nr:hypothetical protein ASCRUDRAFT_138736 [Ascoidea rubescens DSM 1968]ODV61873.1 hypothetical protein ASCRUDRAFT_138736 [Ascoidea rubescens DSM 1968]
MSAENNSANLVPDKDDSASTQIQSPIPKSKFKLDSSETPTTTKDVNTIHHNLNSLRLSNLSKIRDRSLSPFQKDSSIPSSAVSSNGGIPSLASSSKYLSSNDKTDIKKLSPQELKIYKLYGKLPSSSEILNSKLKHKQYFDTCDYALNFFNIDTNDPVVNDNINNINYNSSIHNHSRKNSINILNSINVNTTSTDASTNSINNINTNETSEITNEDLNTPPGLTHSPTNSISSSISLSNNLLPLPNLEKLSQLNIKREISRHGSMVSVNSKEILKGIINKSNLENQIDSDAIESDYDTDYSSISNSNQNPTLINKEKITFNNSFKFNNSPLDSPKISSPSINPFLSSTNTTPVKSNSIVSNSKPTNK